jgi:hypothetical protein
MNPMDPDFWRRQWEAFSSAPVACVVFLVVGAVAAWWFRRSVDQGEIKGLRAQIGGLKEQISALEQRLKLAGEQEQVAMKATQSLREEGATLKAQLEGAIPKERIQEAKHEVQKRITEEERALASFEAQILKLERAQEQVLGTLQHSGGKVGGFTVGDQVWHQVFGYGTISEIDNRRLTIDFYMAGKKKVMDNYVQHYREIRGQFGDRVSHIPLDMTFSPAAVKSCKEIEAGDDAPGNPRVHSSDP